MQDFETTANDADSDSEQDERSQVRERLSNVGKTVLRRFILFLSFGPGVLGFLWLLGRILKR
ncbi:MAG TPA: hypothetical protein V6C81_26095 [Planktothrix sp.]|jgi:hypothetical protein